MEGKEQGEEESKIKDLKVQVFDILAKQGSHQNAIKELETEKIKLLGEMNKLVGADSG